MKKLGAALAVLIAFGCGDGLTGPPQEVPDVRADLTPAIAAATTDVQWFVLVEVDASGWGPDVQPGDRLLGTISFTAEEDGDPLPCYGFYQPLSDTRIEFPALGIDDQTPGWAGVSELHFETCLGQEWMRGWIYAFPSGVSLELVGSGLLGGVAELQTPDLSGTLTANAFGLMRLGKWLSGTLIAISPTALRTKDDCKEGGWEVHGFDNQGQCVRFIETGKDSR